MAWTSSEIHIALNVPDVTKVVELCMERMIGKCAFQDKEKQGQAGHRALKREGQEDQVRLNNHNSIPKSEHRIENYGREVKKAKTSGKEYEMQKQRICIWCSRVSNVHRKTSWFCRACDKPYCRDGTNGRNCFSHHIEYGEPEIGAYKKTQSPKVQD